MAHRMYESFIESGQLGNPDMIKHRRCRTMGSQFSLLQSSAHFHSQINAKLVGREPYPGLVNVDNCDKTRMVDSMENC